MARSGARFGVAGRIVLALVVVVIVVSGTAVWVALPTGSSSSTQSTSSTVQVFGLVSVTGAGTHPTYILFTNAQTGQPTQAPVVAGHYSVQLPNHMTYNVSLGWSGNYTGQAGREPMGQLSVDMAEGSMMAQSYNVVQQTPASMVWVNGTIAWGMITASPSAIRFTASDGENFTAAVQGRAFAVRLPNMMTFEINVESRNSTGYTEWFYFHQLEVNAGLNVVGITVHLG